MDKHKKILAGAERAFEAEGFRGIGVDKILAQSGASTRTLYKHFGSRDGLVLEVLQYRHLVYMGRLLDTDPFDPIGQLFEVQRQWVLEHKNSGCMFIRAYGEYIAVNADIIAVVYEHKRQFQAEIERRVESAIGRSDAQLALQIWLLFEGATALTSFANTSALVSAKDAAKILLQSRLEGAS
jgi:AcrR family transcriptional regulator